MSVYIPGMEMPEDGFITITVTSDGRVVGNSKKENGKFEYLDNEDIAKAVPVPPHGRLGDLDALKARATKRLYASNHGSMAEAYYAALIDLIDAEPAVIPADTGG